MLENRTFFGLRLTLMESNIFDRKTSYFYPADIPEKEITPTHYSGDISS